MADRLVEEIASYGRCVVAFSGGVDSAVVAAAALRASGSETWAKKQRLAEEIRVSVTGGTRETGCDSPVAITASGPALADSERGIAERVAREIGISHEFVDADEISSDGYRQNQSNRCYFCKSSLYSTLQRYAQEFGFAAIVNGTNADDLGDYRPGLRAAAEYGVRQPLADLAIDKWTVRELAAFWNLSIAEKPAAPCLASRIAYGQTVDSESLKMVELGESYFRELGFTDVRVRLHADRLARIELHPSELGRLMERSLFSDVDAEFKRLGFRFVTLDCGGRQSGSLNRSLPIVDV
jgi:uncharacterized protein